jgi:hypothetical protein
VVPGIIGIRSAIRLGSAPYIRSLAQEKLYNRECRLSIFNREVSVFKTA